MKGPRQWRAFSSSQDKYFELPFVSFLPLLTICSLQYYFETNQPKRTNFIARQLSFHGNTLGTLSLAYHPTRRLPYAAVLDQTHFHHVSPAYAKRFQKPDETEEEYVERLRQELENKFIELGPDTVIGCTQMN